MKSLIVSLTLTMLLTGCVTSPFTPKDLPDACLNQPYVAKINIGRAKVIGSLFTSKISDSNFSLSPKPIYREARMMHGRWQKVSVSHDRNELTISSTPSV